MASQRPEHQAPPEIFYNDDEARKYASSSRMQNLQTEMAERCLELCLLPDHPCLLLDVGCGSGISGQAIADAGHAWIGYDVAPSMLEIARERLDDGEIEDGDVLLGDAGVAMRWRPGSFDGCISVSALQWLCNVDKKGHKPYSRLKEFFNCLFTALKKGSRAALQFYPEDAGQVEMITSAALRCGFGGGLVVDYPHSSKAKKHFLVIYAGLSGNIPQNIPVGMQEEVNEDMIANSKRERAPKRKGKKGKAGMSYKDKVITKKQHQRKKSLTIRKDTKYTARSRKSKAM